MTALQIAIALPLGLAFGSFLTVVVDRVPRAESVVHPRSRCPSCGVEIREIDNIPVVSWLCGGRCRPAGEDLSDLPAPRARHRALFVAVVLGVEDPWPADLEAPFAALLLAIRVIDWRTKKIPNAIVYPSLLVWAGAVLVARLGGAEVDVLRAGLGFVIYGGGLLILAFIAPRGMGMGMGDVKLAALIGLVLGAHGLSDVTVAARAGIALGGVAAGNPMRPCSAGHASDHRGGRARWPRAPPASDRESNSAAAPGHGHGEQPTVHAERTQRSVGHPTADRLERAEHVDRLGRSQPVHPPEWNGAVVSREERDADPIQGRARGRDDLGDHGDDGAGPALRGAPTSPRSRSRPRSATGWVRP